MKPVKLFSVPKFLFRTVHISGRRLRLVLSLFFAFTAVNLWFTFSHDAAPSPHSSIPTSNLQNQNITSVEKALAKKETIYIAGLHYNDEALIRSHWTPAIISIVHHYGASNVYISIVESGSWDDTKGALRELDSLLENLGVERSIDLGNSTHHDLVNRMPRFDEKGWISTPRGKKEMRRIPYLAGLRNQAMSKLKPLATRMHGGGMRRFDKVLWLNDVIFTIDDVTNLLATRNGDYAAACSMDFSHPPLYYDTFALRDSDGDPTITMTWPYFLSQTSRNAMLSNEPIPVQSCWNGMAVFESAPFYQDPPLRFRGLLDSMAAHHLEASECCLIHADNALGKERGVWVNPNVRVGYNKKAYDNVRYKDSVWPGRIRKMWGILGNRLVRWFGWPRRYLVKRLVDRKIKEWKEELRGVGEKRGGVGKNCIVNEMQILADDGWLHL